MSMISEQVADLREKAQVFEDSGCATNGIVKTFREAADTIEKLSAKLADVNMERSTAYYNNGWIPCSERLPKKNGRYLVTQKRYPIDDNKHEKLLSIETDYAEFSVSENKWRRANMFEVTAWMPAEPYKGVE